MWASAVRASAVIVVGAVSSFTVVTVSLDTGIYPDVMKVEVPLVLYDL